MITGMTLGEGGYGVVKKITIDGREMAGKFVRNLNNRGVMKTFESETTALHRLLHPNIVEFYGYETIDEDGVSYHVIKMELCQRNSLRRLLQDTKVVYSMKTILTWADQLFSALNYLKDELMVHRDIKPENILLKEDFVLKLADFGCMKEMTIDTSLNIRGTVRYMAPECYNKTINPANAFSGDLFSAALVVWEMIERCQVNLNYGSGRFFREHQYFADLKTGQYVLLPPLSKHGIAQIIHRCTNKDPSKRPVIADAYQTIRAMNRAFQRFDFMPQIVEDQMMTMMPIGFDGCTDPIPTKDIHDDPISFDSVSEARENRMWKIICRIRWQTSVYHPELKITAIEFAKKCLPDGFLKPDLFEAFIESIEDFSNQILLRPYSIDQLPGLRDFAVWFQKVKKRFLDQQWPDSILIHICLYLRGQMERNLTLTRAFHFKSLEFFLKDLPRSLPLIIGSKQFHETFYRLVILYERENLKNAWILLSSKTLLAMPLDFSGTEKLDGDYVNEGTFHLNNGITLKKSYVVGFNDAMITNLCSLKRDGKLKSKRFQLMEGYRRKSYDDPESAYPFYPLIFLIHMKPSEFPFIIYSVVIKEKVDELDTFHKYFANFFSKGESKGFPNFPFCMPYFYFIRLKKAVFSGAIILELPADEGKSSVMCIGLRSKKISWISIGYEDIDQEKVIKLTFNQLRSIIQSNKSFRPRSRSSDLVSPEHSRLLESTSL